jgi:hypothetical protein
VWSARSTIRRPTRSPPNSRDSSRTRAELPDSPTSATGRPMVG